TRQVQLARQHGADVAAQTEVLARLYKEMVQEFPEEPAYRDNLVATLLILAGLQVNLQNHERAAQAVAELKALTPPVREEDQEAAAVVARCVPLAEKDKRLSGREQDRRVSYYGGLALALLDEAGPDCRDRTALKKSPDFAPLRDRDEFRKRFADLLK